MIHRLKCWAENFDAIAAARARALVRGQSVGRGGRQGAMKRLRIRLVLAIIECGHELVLSHPEVAGMILAHAAKFVSAMVHAPDDEGSPTRFA